MIRNNLSSAVKLQMWFATNFRKLQFFLFTNTNYRKFGPAID